VGLSHRRGRQPGDRRRQAVRAVQHAEARRRHGVRRVQAPTDNFSSTLDVFYSKFKNHQIQRGIELPLVWGGVPLTGPTISGGLVKSGAFNGVKGVVRNDGNDRDATIKSVGWNNKLEAGDDWTLVSDLSWSKVNRTDMVWRSYSGTGRSGAGATDNMTFAINDDGVAIFKSTLNYADPN
jgi:iron complex outermembrane receptor protein